MAASKRPRVPARILVLDIGGTHVHAAFSRKGPEWQIPSGPSLRPGPMVRRVKRAVRGHPFDAVAIGYPGVVVHGRILREPHNLGSGWVGFDFRKALGRPVRIVNDAAMQALGSYRGGRMLFLGLGTGLGSAMVVDGELEPMELGHLPWKKGKTYEDLVGEKARLRLRRKKWQKEIFEMVGSLSAALEPDYVVLGGGNVRKLKAMPPGARPGNNLNAITGGLRLWKPTPAPRGRRRA
ncbi:MAG TPA: ROK family protein [Thermoplasmata archaeon]|nr:ROK family protein [Thermoplasmata archaeon]